MSRITVITPAGPGLAATLRSVRHQGVDAAHVVVAAPGDVDRTERLVAANGTPKASVVVAAGTEVAAINAGLTQATSPYTVLLSSGSTLTRGFLRDAIQALDADPVIGLVAPARPRLGHRAGFDLGSHLIRDGLPEATVFRRAQVPGLDPALGDLARWDAWLGVLGTGSQVRVLAGHAQRARLRGTVADDERLALIMTRHVDLYRDHAEVFWQAVLGQRERLMELKRRYGRFEDLLHRLRALTRRTGAR